jgi:hypothetical protein
LNKELCHDGVETRISKIDFSRIKDFGKDAFKSPFPKLTRRLNIELLYAAFQNAIPLIILRLN